MQELKLSLELGAWRIFQTRKADPAFRAFNERVLRRDNYTCQFCGFQAKDHQEIVNLDRNFGNNKLSNLVTACCFCAQCFFLDAVGLGDYGGGILIYLPEITQANLNSFCHVLFCAISNDTGYKTNAQAIYRSLKFRSQAVENEFGEGTSQPMAFGRMLTDLQVVPERKEVLLQKVRLLPSRSRFKEQIEHWAKCAMREIT